MESRYFLAQYSFDDGEGFYYVLDNLENMSYLSEVEKKDNNCRLVVLKNEYFSNHIVDCVIFSSGLNHLNCNSQFYKCDTIDDMKKNYL